MDNLRRLVSIGNLMNVANRKGYAIFKDNSKPYNLNIWGIRSNNHIAGKFDDLLVVFWRDRDGIWNTGHMVCTVDPSDHYLLNPINPKGTAIIIPDQHRGVWALGKHTGYDALVQRKPITVIRDYNKDDVLDFNSTNTDTGWFGIHLHRASQWNIVRLIGKYSAGCVVVQNHKEYNEFIEVCKQAANHWGNSFTFTLINESDLL
jgi:hypothetical protein